jgi:hypothetical protein
MLESWNRFALAAGDLALGWLLRLPSDAALIAVALGSALLLTFVRRLTTDQSLLFRISRDRARLRELVREARRSGDWEAAARHRALRSAVGMKALRSEAWPLLASLVPVAVVATWCVFRLEFHPPRGGEPVPVVAYAPVSAVGSVMHVVPEEGLEAEAWVRPVAAASEDERGGGPPYGKAVWTLRAAARETPYTLMFRLGEGRYEHALLVGRTTYAPALAFHEEGVVTEVRMRERQLFGLVPGAPQLYLPAWLVAYLILVIPATSVVKRVLGVR